MPKKIRELKAMLRKARVSVAAGKGKSQHLGASAGRQAGGSLGQGRTGRKVVSGTGRRRTDRNREKPAATLKYSMLIQWSPEDEVYLVTLPEFGNALTHGEIYEKAVRQGKELMESCVMWWQQDGKPLPEPIVFEFENQLDVGAAPRRLLESV